MKKLITLVTVLVLSVVLAACGNDEQQGVTDDSVKVGNCVAVSGDYAFIGEPFKAGIDAYFDMVNDDGGINGRTIDYVHEDDGFDTKKGRSCVEKMINDEEIFAFVGHFGTPIVGATLPDIKDAGIPAVYFATGRGDLYNENATGDDRVAYPVQPVYPMEGRILGAWTKGEFNADKVGIIYTNDDAGVDLKDGAEEELNNIGGIEIVTEQVKPGDDSVSSAAIKMGDEGVDAIIVAAIQGTFPTIAKELAAQGNTAPVLTTYVNASKAITDSVATDVGDQYDIYANSWVSMTGDEFDTYKAEIEDDYDYNAYALTGWIAAHFFVTGLERVGDDELTWDSYMDALEESPIQNPFGGEIDYSDGKRLGTQEMALLKMNADETIGWEGYKPIMSIPDILGE